MRVRSTTALLAVLTAAALAVGLAPAAVAAEPPPPRAYVTGWLPYWLPESATASVVNNKAVFDDASPFVFDVQSAREIDLQLSSSAWDAMRSQLRTAGIANIPTLSTDLSADQFASLLSSRKRRSAHVNTLVRLADRYNVAGLDLDYESINFGSSSAKRTVRRLYPVLVSALEKRLDGDGRLLSVTVASRTSPDDPNWWVYDYKALGSAADRLRLMTYDYSWSGGSPGPMAPKSWVDDVLAFATNQVAPSKISFGLPSYGRDWFVKTNSGTCPSSARETLSRSTRDMIRFADRVGVTPRWDVAGTSRTFTYTKTYRSGGQKCRAKRVVWYDDARSVAAKVRLVEKYQIRGVAMWALGYESSAMWRELRSYGDTIAARRPNLSLSAPKQVSYGTGGTVQATVRSGGEAVSGTRVVLQRRAVGTTDWTTVAARPTGPLGVAAFDVAPRRHTEWRVRTGATWALLADASVPATTRVAYAVQVRGAQQVVARRASWNVQGSVAAPGSGVTVVLQRKIDGAWVDRVSQVADRDGTFEFSRRLRGSGELLFRVKVPADKLDGAVSRRLAVQVG